MKYDIEALKRKMLVKYPFFGSVVAGVKYKEDSEIPTAGTDGEVIYYNPDFLKDLSVGEQAFVFAHEVCHIAFNHILRSDGKDPQVWNIATDAVINAFLRRDGLKMIDGGVDIEGALNYDAEQLYEKLMKEKNEQQQEQESNDQQQNRSQSGSSNQQSQEQSEEDQSNKNDKSDSNGQNGSQNEQASNNEDKSKEQSDENQSEQNGESNLSNSDVTQESNEQDVGHDTHKMWEEAVKKHKEKQNKDSQKEENQNKDNQKEENQNKDNQKEEKSEIEKKQEELQDMGEKASFAKNLIDKKQQLEELKKAIARQVSQAGNFTNGDIRSVNDIGSSKPLIDWRYVLREAIQYDVDWSYKNATIEDGVVSANLEELPMPETEIVLDTSGSINEVLLKNFLRECKNILKQSRVKVGCFDTQFYGFHEIRTEEDIENMPFQGGGGTNFDVAVSAFTKRVENKIIFTDGEADMPSMPIDAIWIVFGYQKINPKGGKVIYITYEQLQRLYSFIIKDKVKCKTR